jgi:hypothetical protein
MLAPKTKPTAEKLRAWRASLLRSRAHLLGIVYAPDEKSAEAAAIAEFKIGEDQRRRLVVRRNSVLTNAFGAMAPLILTRASLSRSSGQWRDDDYDVSENGAVVGRIFFLDAVGPQGRPWMWASGHGGHIKRAAHGYEATREAAMAAFAKSWRGRLSQRE